MRTALAGIAAAFCSVLPAAAMPCLTAAPARLRAASAVLSLTACVASSVNCCVSAPHHCIGSMAAGAVASAALVAAALRGAGAGSSGSASGSGSRAFKASRRSVIGRFIVFSVASVMRCTSSAWMVVPSRRAFCSSQNCTVFNSWMRFSISSGSKVGAIHWPKPCTPGRLAPAPFIRFCRNSKPGTMRARSVGLLITMSPSLLMGGRS